MTKGIFYATLFNQSNSTKARLYVSTNVHVNSNCSQSQRTTPILTARAASFTTTAVRWYNVKLYGDCPQPIRKRPPPPVAGRELRYLGIAGGADQVVGILKSIVNIVGSSFAFAVILCTGLTTKAALR